MIIGKKNTNRNDKNYQKTECYFLIQSFSSESGNFTYYSGGAMPKQAFLQDGYRSWYGWWGWYGYYGYNWSWDIEGGEVPDFSINANAYAQLSLNLFGNNIYLDLNGYANAEVFRDLQHIKIESEYRRLNIIRAKKYYRRADPVVDYYGGVDFNGAGSSNYTAYISINSDNSS